MSLKILIGNNMSNIMLHYQKKWKELGVFSSKRLIFLIMLALQEAHIKYYKTNR